MSHFTKQVQTQEGLLNFYFNRVYTVNGTRYHVSVRGPRAHHHFMMSEKNGNWSIAWTVKPIEWLQEAEKDLENAIVAHLSTG